MVRGALYRFKPKLKLKAVGTDKRYFGRCKYSISLLYKLVFDLI